MRQPTYNTILPPLVRFDKALSANAKLLYGEIKALCDQQGYCWASNHYLATLYGVHKETISLWLRQLKEGGWILIHLAQDQGNQRKIYLNDTSSAPTPSYEKSQEAAGKMSRGLMNSSLPSCELIVPKPASLLIEKNIDNNDRIYSDSLKDISRSGILEEGEKNAKKVDTRSSERNDVSAPAPQVTLSPGMPATPPRRKTRQSFVKPSVKEAEAYMLSQKELCPDALTARTQALRFVNYYESNGWKVGRNAMQDWQAAANNWLLNAQTYQSPKPTTHDRLHSGGKKDYSIPL